MAIKYRKKLPVLAFAIIWFFVGHSMESSIVPLEIYFEHRNYIPIIGPLFALSYYAWHHHLPMPKLRIATLFALGLLFVFVLYENSQTWKNPIVAAGLWVNQHPRSVRANQYLSLQYIKQGQLKNAQITIAEAYKSMPDDTGFALQILQLNCVTKTQTEKMHAQTQQTLRNGSFSLAAFVTLVNIELLREKDRCPQLTIEDIRNLTDNLIQNRKFIKARKTLAKLYKFKAELYAKSGLLRPAAQYLDLSFSTNADLDTALTKARLLWSAELYNEAIISLEAGLEHLPRNPLKRAQWKKEINQLMKIIKAENTQGNNKMSL